jgi:2-polyprenyl-3-methyl-5-hydroxy-6-metoxy-1,4-benzoquinol methylase
MAAACHGTTSTERVRYAAAVVHRGRVSDPIADGHYAKIQIGNRNKIVAWSHQSRFDKAVSLLGPGVDRLLDYGCGDGTFLALASTHVGHGHGADLDANQIAECAERLASIENLTFSPTPELVGPEHDASYDVVVCMETLEHCPDDAVEIVLSDLARLVKPGGRVVISVPIEIGPSFLVKQPIRSLTRRRGTSNYGHREVYPVKDALRMVFARRTTEFDRPVHGEPPMVEHTHYGFNWRLMRERVARHLEITETQFTPLPALGGWASSQAYFLCVPR